MTSKLTKTDHHEQSLPLDKETSYLVREACNAMLENTRYPVEMRDRAMKLKAMLEDPSREDRPAAFYKSHGSMMRCPDCQGTGNYRHLPEDRNDEIEFEPCPTCKGDGQLYFELIRKCYVPTEYHRRKLAK